MPPIQARRAVGPAQDAFEQEADRIADEVMRMPAPVSAHTHAQDATTGLEHGVQRDAAEEEELQRKPLAASITPLLQRDAIDEDELQRMGGDEGFEADEGLSQQIQSARGGGRPLESNTRSFMEARFGSDFSGVRVHADTEAARLSRDLSAHAFTLGNDIFFGAGRYQPESDSGKHLLAHELTHVVQQGGTRAAGQHIRALHSATTLGFNNVNPVNDTAQQVSGISLMQRLHQRSTLDRNIQRSLQSYVDAMNEKPAPLFGAAAKHLNGESVRTIKQILVNNLRGADQIKASLYKAGRDEPGVGPCSNICRLTEPFYLKLNPSELPFDYSTCTNKPAQEKVREKTKTSENKTSLSCEGLPSDFSSHIGLMSYYQDRHEDFEQRHCRQVTPPGYYLKYGDKYIQQFKQLSPRLSPRGQQWVDTTRALLQKAIEDRRAQNPVEFDALEHDSAKFKAFAFDTHPKAYLDGGLRDLPPMDLCKIGREPDLKDLMELAGIKQVMETALRYAVKDPYFYSMLIIPPVYPLQWLTACLVDYGLEATGITK